MPALEWMGKSKVINHHQDVPFRTLERVYSYDETGQHETDIDSPNMIIHGDSLEALKSLLPKYEGKVNVVLSTHLITREMKDGFIAITLMILELLNGLGKLSEKKARTSHATTNGHIP